MKLEHRDYQKTAIEFLIENPTSGLFLDPGLGKTSVALTYIDFLKDYFKGKKVLIIAPKRVCRLTWPDEMKKWDRYKNITYTVLQGLKRHKKLQRDYDIYLINREGLPWLLKQTNGGRTHKFDVLIIDESTKFKSWKSKYFRMLLKMVKGFPRRHIMTGTPAPNGYLDLFSQIFILDLGESLGDSFTHYQNTYFSYNPYKYKWSIKEGAEKIIQDKIKHLILRMSEDDYLQLPEKTDNLIYVELEGEASRVYDDLEKRLFAEIDNDKVVLNSSTSSYSACRQVASGNLYQQEASILFPQRPKGHGDRPYYKIHEYKLEALESLIESLGGSPLLIAYNYNHELDALLKAWPKTPYIGRGVSDEESDSVVKRWNEGVLPFIFCQPASMSHGLNMQKVGRNVCWFSLTDNLEDYLQFNKRVHRSGVSGSVIIHHILAKDTVDEVVFNRNTQKTQTQNSLLAALREYKLGKV